MSRDNERFSGGPPPDDRFDDEGFEPEPRRPRSSGPREYDIQNSPMLVEDLRQVAIFQKVVILCILVYLLSLVGQFFVPEELRIFFGLGILGVGLIGAVFVFLLAVRLYGVALGLVAGFFTLIPCVGLIVLLIINAKATGLLQRHGVQVGLLGARLTDLDRNRDRNRDYRD